MTTYRASVLAKICGSGATKASPMRLHGAEFSAAMWLYNHDLVGAVGSRFFPIQRMRKSDFAKEFREYWEREIIEQAEDGTLEDLLWFWDSLIEARVTDGTLQPEALRWKEPAWLVALNKQYQTRRKA